MSRFYRKDWVKRKPYMNEKMMMASTDNIGKRFRSHSQNYLPTLYVNRIAFRITFLLYQLRQINIK